MLIDELIGELKLHEELKLREELKLPENLQDDLHGEIEKVPDV